METFIKNLAKGAGAILKDGFGKKTKIESKRMAWDMVTDYDRKAEQFIISKIKAKFPDHGIIAEESEHILGKKNFWIIDPIDGTWAFVKGLKQFSVSIAFVSNNQIKLGAVYSPATDELFFAQADKGAYYNNRKIFTKPKESLDFTTTALFLDSLKTTKQEKQEVYKIVVQNFLWLSRVESAALSLCYVALGGYDMFISKGLSSWDWAAGALILKEAGSKVTNFSGKNYNWKDKTIVGAHPSIHKKIVKLLKKIA